MKVKLNLTPQNKHEWEALGWDLRASSNEGVGTHDFLDEFVDDNYGNIIHENGMTIYERSDLGVDVQIRDLGLNNFQWDWNNETLLLIKKMFDKGLFYIDDPLTKP